MRVITGVMIFETFCQYFFIGFGYFLSSRYKIKHSQQCELLKHTHVDSLEEFNSVSLVSWTMGPRTFTSLPLFWSRHLHFNLFFSIYTN